MREIKRNRAGDSREMGGGSQTGAEECPGWTNKVKLGQSNGRGGRKSSEWGGEAARGK